MTATLRPMNLGEILDRTFQIYRKRFCAFVIVAAIPALIVQGLALADAFWFHLYSSAIRDNHWAPGVYMTQVVFVIGYYHFASFIGFLLFPVILKFVSGIVFNDETKIREGWRFFGVRWRSYLWLAVLKLLAELVIVEALTFVLFGLTMETLEALGAQSFLEAGPSLMIAGLWFAAGFVAFLWVGSALSLAIPSAAFENLKAFRALRRSWILTRGSRWRIALTWVALATASWIFSVSIEWTLRFIVISAVRFTHARWISYTLYPILSQTINMVLAALLESIYPIAVTLFYYDQRIRHEGCDIERMMESAGLNSPVTVPHDEGALAHADATEPAREGSSVFKGTVLAAILAAAPSWSRPRWSRRRWSALAARTTRRWTNIASIWLP